MRRIAVVMSLLGLSGLFLVAGQVARAAPPTWARTLVGPSVAAMYPSGLEYDRANDRLVIADTGLDRVLVYSKSGVLLTAFGGPGSGNGQFEIPRDVAVDGAGNIYVADTANGRVQSFTSTGVFRWLVRASDYRALTHPMGLTWDRANNQLIVSGTGANQVSGWSAAGTQLWVSPAAGTTGLSDPRDAGRAPDGTIWVADYGNNRVVFYQVSPSGVWSDAPGPNYYVAQVRNPTGTGATGFLYNVDFSPDGRTMYIAATGVHQISRYDISAGVGSATILSPIGRRSAQAPDPCPDPPAPGSAGVFHDLRRVAVDNNGRIYGADCWGNGVEVFAPDGTPVLSIEGVSAPAPGVARAVAVDVSSDGYAYVFDQLNHRIERFAPNGQYLNSRGYRAEQPGYFLWPEGLTLAPNGSVWAMDTRNNRIERFGADLSGSATVYSSGGTGIGALNYPVGSDVDASGRVWMTDQNNNRIVRFDPASGTWAAFGSAGSGQGQFRVPEGIAVTANSVYVADTGNNRIQRLSLTGGFQAASSMPLSRPEGIDVAADGTIWVADTFNNRVVHLNANLVDLGDTFGSLGTGAGNLNRPHDVALRGQELYVADTYNNRVQVFTLSTAPPTSTTTTTTVPPVGGEPNSVVTSPAAGASVGSPVSVAGMATDNAGVNWVRYAIRNQATLQWLTASGSFGAFTLFDAALTSPGAGSTAWSATVTLPAGTYGLDVRAVDTGGLVETSRPWVAFTVAGGGPTTTTTTTVPPVGGEPNSVVTSPAAGATVGSAVAVAGTATDNTGVNRVRYAIRNQATLQWLTASGSFGAFTLFDAALTSPGAGSTAWSATVTLPAGTYGLDVRAVDTGGLVETSRPWVAFTVS